MKKSHFIYSRTSIFMAIILFGVILSGCGPSQTELDASAAQVAATQAALEHIPDRIDALLMQRQALLAGERDEVEPVVLTLDLLTIEGAEECRVIGDQAIQVLTVWEEARQATQEAANTLRQFLFKKVYNIAGEEAEQAREVVRILYQYFTAHDEALPQEYRLGYDSVERRVVDYISGMTDNYALSIADEIIHPEHE